MLISGGHISNRSIVLLFYESRQTEQNKECRLLTGGKITGGMYMSAAGFTRKGWCVGCTLSSSFFSSLSSMASPLSSAGSSVNFLQKAVSSAILFRPETLGTEGLSASTALSRTLGTFIPVADTEVRELLSFGGFSWDFDRDLDLFLSHDLLRDLPRRLEYKGDLLRLLCLDKLRDLRLVYEREGVLLDLDLRLDRESERDRRLALDLTGDRECLLSWEKGCDPLLLPGEDLSPCLRECDTDLWRDLDLDFLCLEDDLERARLSLDWEVEWDSLSCGCDLWRECDLDRDLNFLDLECFFSGDLVLSWERLLDKDACSLLLFSVGSLDPFLFFFLFSSKGDLEDDLRNPPFFSGDLQYSCLSRDRLLDLARSSWFGSKLSSPPFRVGSSFNDFSKREECGERDRERDFERERDFVRDLDDLAGESERDRCFRFLRFLLLDLCFFLCLLLDFFFAPSSSSDDAVPLFLRLLSSLNSSTPLPVMFQLTSRTQITLYTALWSNNIASIADNNSFTRSHKTNMATMREVRMLICWPNGRLNCKEERKKSWLPEVALEQMGLMAPISPTDSASSPITKKAWSSKPSWSIVLAFILCWCCVWGCGRLWLTWSEFFVFHVSLRLIEGGCN